MGAEFNSMTVDGDKPRKEIERLFIEEQNQDRYENGHSYSGGFGMATGLKFEDRKPFPTDKEAEAYLQDHCEKWEDAIAVPFTDASGAIKWLIGAWCAS